MQHIQVGLWVMSILSFVLVDVLELENDTLFIKIDQGIQILQLKKDQKFLLLYYFLNVFIYI